MTRVMRCRVGLEADEPVPTDEEEPVPDPCEVVEGGGWKGKSGWKVPSLT